MGEMVGLRKLKKHQFSLHRAVIWLQKPEKEQQATCRDPWGRRATREDAGNAQY
jgi:hypothetical protein